MCGPKDTRQELNINFLMISFSIILPFLKYETAHPNKAANTRNRHSVTLPLYFRVRNISHDLQKK